MGKEGESNYKTDSDDNSLKTNLLVELLKSFSVGGPV